VLVIRIKDVSLVEACDTALDVVGQARERILANLAASDAGGRLLDIIPSLGPFIEITDKIATVRFNMSDRLHIHSDIVAGSPIRERCMADHIVDYQSKVLV
jgi:hypothetical protein